MIEGSGSVMDPEPGGPKTYGSYGSGTATLPKPMAYSLILLGIEGPAKQMEIA